MPLLTKPASATTEPSAAPALLDRLRSRPWAVVDTGRAPAAWNMAVDEALLERCSDWEVAPTLRFYAWEPTAVSVGRFQPVKAGIDWEYCRARGWEAVRRPTGGRALLHQHEVTYSIVLPRDLVGPAGVRTTYRALNHLLRLGLERVTGALREDEAAVSRAGQSPNCFAHLAASDLGSAMGKCVGSAQVRRGGALLQHGSIILEAEPEAWRRLFGGVGALTSLREVCGRPVEAAEVQEALLAGLFDLGIETRERELDGLTLDLARRLTPADPWEHVWGGSR